MLTDSTQKNILSLVVCSKSLKSQSLKSSSLLLFCYFQKHCKSMLSGSVGVNISQMANGSRSSSHSSKIQWIINGQRGSGAETVEESITLLKMIPI